MSCLYILEINPLSVVSFAIIFSHSEGCLFILLIVSSAVQKLLSLSRSHLFTFVSISVTLGGQLEKAMAPHSSTLAWKIPRTEEPGGLWSMGSLRVRHNWVTSLSHIGEGNGNPLQCSCLENPRDGGAWWAAVYGITWSRTRLTWLSSSSSDTAETSILDSRPQNYKTVNVCCFKPPLGYSNIRKLIHPPQADVFSVCTKNSL